MTKKKPKDTPSDTCVRCGNTADRTHVCKGWKKERKVVEEPDPAQENAIRALEDLEW